ncbi:hypothetical protein O3M35_002011 [Rhynocoris fuscipes]|uniref:Uncharacterized protein n=1 Tax=Rhynocoris fuscipes TaxID=488301 RepID=A0AAW1CQM6_9HEMI
MSDIEQGEPQYGELTRDDAFVRLCTLRRKISVDSTLQVVLINWEIDDDIMGIMDNIYKQFDKINEEYTLKEKKLKKRLLSDLMATYDGLKNW